jgi:3-oxoacyl-(acyl-carrier-protein) synthase/thioesterase domain-containing protein/acyl carrier protein
MSTPEDYTELLKSALTTIRRQKAQIQQFEAERSEPVAVIGIGCMLPPAIEGVTAFWESQVETLPAVKPMPRNRSWLETVMAADQRTTRLPLSRSGIFLDDVFGFDAGTFGISSLEAESMDPQHRLLLEATWIALEDATIPPDGLSGSTAGAFVGVMNHDYGHIACADLGAVRVHAAAGNGLGVAAGRLAHTFGLTGPAIAVDTNCSSSLVAVHLAVNSLRSHECDLAIAAGANLILSPAMNIVMGMANALSPSDRCRSFDARADGYGRGEGCASVILKRASDAIAAHDRIYALVRGTAVNHGGRTAALSVPSARAQEAVMRRALQNARLLGSDVDYVETHGTGTPLGDPIELEAIHSVYGARADKLFLGSVKNALGHLEGAAGIVSFIRAVLAIHHGKIPPFGGNFVPTPRFDWTSSKLGISASERQWSGEDKPRRAAVSAFGFSGTNCHAILEQASPVSEQVGESGQLLLCLSAASPLSLDRLIDRHVSVLATCSPDQANALCRASSAARASQRWRAAFMAPSADALVQALKARAGDYVEVDPGFRPWLCAVLREDWDWYLGFGTELHRNLAAFRSELEAWRATAGPALEQLVSVLRANGAAAETGPSREQRLIMQVAMLNAFRSIGFAIDQVQASGLSEISAACAAGVIDRRQAFRVAALLPADPLTRLDDRSANAVADILGGCAAETATLELVTKGRKVSWREWCLARYWREFDIRPAPIPRQADQDSRLWIGASYRDNEEVVGKDIWLDVEVPQRAFHESIAQWFLRGGRPEWRAISRACETAAQPPTPPYAFDRKPTFIKPLARGGDGADEMAVRPEPATSVPPVANGTRKPTLEDVLDQLRRLLSEFAGGDSHAMGPQMALANIGVDSLMALEIRNRLESRYGVQIPIQALTQASTVLDYAQAVVGQTNGAAPSGQSARDGGRLVPVRPAESPSATLVLIHAVGGTVQSYQRLAHRLDEKLAVLAIGASVDTDETASSIAGMARDYLDQVERASLAGNLVFAGWSMGGLVALEMAALSRSRNRPISRVQLFDTIVPQSVEERSAAALDEAALGVFALDLGFSAEDVEAISKRADFAERAIVALRRRAVERKILSDSVSVGDLDWHFRIMRKNFAAFLAYRPASYVETVDYFKARDASFSGTAGSRHLGADELRGPTREWVVPGNHFNLMREPQVGVLADLVNASIDVIRPGPPGGLRQTARSEKYDQASSAVAGPMIEQAVEE